MVSHAPCERGARRPCGPPRAVSRSRVRGTFLRTTRRLHCAARELVRPPPSPPAPTHARPPACLLARHPRAPPRRPLPQSHTIVLVQAGNAANTRTYMDFASKAAAMDGIIRMFEEFLKTNNRRAPTITYDVQDLFAYLDGMTDISCLM